MLSDAGITSRPISSHTPTSNALVESVHRAIGQVIRALVALYPPKTPDEAPMP